MAYKPPYISSNGYLTQLKKRYGVQKAGFSGTLDPFAQGVLVVAFGAFTRLFRYLKTAPKRYRGVVWLGVQSESLDIENILKIVPQPPLEESTLRSTLTSLLGEQSYTPPSFSAKKIDGKRAYALARSGAEVHLKPIVSTLYAAELLHYRHPFVTFEMEVSEGAYIRSLAGLWLERLGRIGTLSFLERRSEGNFFFEGERPLDPIPHLDLAPNRYLGACEDLRLGRKLAPNMLQYQDEGTYALTCEGRLSVLEVVGGVVRYHLNGVELC